MVLLLRLGVDSNARTAAGIPRPTATPALCRGSPDSRPQPQDRTLGAGHHEAAETSPKQGTTRNRTGRTGTKETANRSRTREKASPSREPIPTAAGARLQWEENPHCSDGAPTGARRRPQDAPSPVRFRCRDKSRQQGESGGDEYRTLQQREETNGYHH